MRKLAVLGICGLFASEMGASTAIAAEEPSSFRLGEIIVLAPPLQGPSIGGSSVSAEPIYLFNRNSLDEAAALIPGVSAGNSGGSRNERLIFVRGFDRFQVPLSIDGIRVYLPADNRLDYGRFLTPDIAQIQVAKAYASVLDGPGAMGGAINLVTRKPTKPIEAEARATLHLDRDADYAGHAVFALLGTRQNQWYAQASYTRNFQDHWDLPGSFAPTANEDGDARDFSRTRDWRLNLKAGFTPNATDEYAISYTRQEGAKNAPLHVTDDIVAPLVPGSPTPRYWRWPYWNIENIYFLSTTALGDRATLKTRAYRNKMDNLLRSFDDRAQTTQNSPMPRVFNSPYADEAWGGSAQLDVDLTPGDRLSVAAHYRRDKHVEGQQTFPNVAVDPAGFTEPDQQNLEDNYSIAAENHLTLVPDLTATVGLSFDWRDIKKAEEYGTPPGGGASRLFSYPLRNTAAFNWQGRLEWSPDAETEIHASVSRRARFPTIFERFSTQFGTAASNPGLLPERATNYEVGARAALGPVRVAGAAFYSDIERAIVSIRPVGSTATTTRRENLGSAHYYGAEISVNADLAPSLSLGANYSYIQRSFKMRPLAGSILPAAFELTDVPAHKGFVYASWTPIARLTVVPSVEFASRRTTLASTTPTPPGTPFYYRTGAYANASLRMDYALIDRVALGVGARNLFDDSYQLVDGFPEQGRSFFASLRATY